MRAVYDWASATICSYSDVAIAFALFRSSARRILVGGDLLRLQRPDLGLALLDRRLERTRVELEQQLALLNHVTVLETDLLDVPAHAGAHVDRLRCLEPAVVVVFVHQAADDRMGHGHPGASRALSLLADWPQPANTMTVSMNVKVDDRPRLTLTILETPQSKEKNRRPR